MSDTNQLSRIDSHEYDEIILTIDKLSSCLKQLDEEIIRPCCYKADFTTNDENSITFYISMNIKSINVSVSKKFVLNAVHSLNDITGAECFDLIFSTLELSRKEISSLFSLANENISFINSTLNKNPNIHLIYSFNNLGVLFEFCCCTNEYKIKKSIQIHLKF